MSPNQKNAIALEKLDLSGVFDKLQTQEGFEVRRAQRTIKMYKRFLKMAMTSPGSIIVPNEDVDKAWHHHILDTQAYMRDCQILFGQYLHHNPHFYGTDAFFEACKTTQQMHQNEFGTDEVFLGEQHLSPAICGGMLKDEAETNLAPAICGGMLKDENEANLSPAICGGMLKDEVEVNLAPAICGGMLKDDTTPLIAKHVPNYGFKPYTDETNH